MAKGKGVILAEAMTIYHLPLYKKLKEFIASGMLGAVRMIQLNFGSYREYDMTSRFFNKNLAGGALLDIGVYAISLARYFMSIKPKQILSQVRFAESGVDEQAGILLMNERAEMATIALTLPKRAVIAFEKGYIEIMEYPRADEEKIVYTSSGTIETIVAGKRSDALQYEMEDIEEAIISRKKDMLLTNTIDVMDIMTEIRHRWGMYYDSEKIF